MKLLKTIFSLFFIAVSLLCSKVITIDNFVKVINPATEESQSISKGQDQKATVTQAITKVSYFLKTSTSSSLTPRLDGRDFLETLFISFFSCQNIRNARGYLYDNIVLQFIPHALIIIYPHHDFW